jgi:solute carrier family 35 protein E1
MRMVKAHQDLMLPVTKGDVKILSGGQTPPLSQQVISPVGEATALGMQNSLHGRPRAPSVANSMMSSYNTHSHNGPLTIQVTPPLAGRAKDGTSVLSPTEPYPSPPPSLDSPPTTAALLSEIEHKQNRFLTEGGRDIYVH